MHVHARKYYCWVVMSFREQQGQTLSIKARAGRDGLRWWDVGEENERDRWET